MIVAIVGPTGVGKTKMSIELAKCLNAIIINCDAVQVYRELNIGSAKVTEEEKEGISHFLLDIKNINEDYTVMDYQKDLRELIKKYNHQNIIIVGGTGLYLCAGLMDYRFEEEKEDNNSYDELSNEELYQLAIAKDGNCDIHQNNRVRLIRFLNRKNTVNVEPKLLYSNVHFIGLTTDRDNLYKVINRRVDKMIEQGLYDEAQRLYVKYPESRVLHSAIGYKELIAHFDGKISLEEAIDNIKQNSRHYAKRQYTWFNNKMDVKWFEVNYADFSQTIESVKKYLKI
ncbi:MAG: tRNA (adenosine(37)-N6)-dimethylallyltransferase MiaA [Firmicutes bacterium]|nr:tRNA (adenosine(37)-N6)-dimethylallyltransferase MiaA [Bacillota bacterium]